MVNKSIKLDYLDSLRGIAAFVVVIGHTNDSFKSDDKYLFEFFFNFLCNYTFFNGHYSVCVFFVLSGFVLSYSYFRNFDFDYVIKQSIKRFPRLLLPVLATSILYFFAKLLDIYYNVEVVNISNEPWFGKFWHEAYSLKQLFFRCIYDLFIFHDQGFLHNINFCLWTMPIELQFSFLLFS
ncbi:MAG: hypothetical protein RLZZ175_2705, partial [Bacteroidota bacterium]